jgi:hypothetical protein
MELVIAIYAAVVATGTLWWQIRNSRRLRRPNVEVGASVMAHVGKRGPTDRLQLRVAHRSQHPIRWTDVRFYKKGPRGAQQWWTLEGPDLDLPLTVPPLDGAEGWIDVRDVESWGFDLDEPLGIEFRFGTGEVIELPPTRFRWEDHGTPIYESATGGGQPRKPMIW